MTALAFLLLGALAASFYLGKERAETERSRAEIERARAEREASELAYARGDAWAARARVRSALEISDDVRARALWMRLEADPIRMAGKIEATRVLYSDRFLLMRWMKPILAVDPDELSMQEIGDPAESYSFAAHGDSIAIGWGDGSVSIGDRRGPVSALAFSRDGSSLATTARCALPES